MMMSSDSLEQQLSDSFEQCTDRKTSLSSALDSKSVTAKPKVSSSGLKMTPPIKSKSWTAPAVAIGIALLLFGRSSPLFSVSSLQKELIRDIVKEKTVADEDVSFTRENIQRNVAANATSTSTTSTTSVTATTTEVHGSSSKTNMKESEEQSPTKETEHSEVEHENKASSAEGKTIENEDDQSIAQNLSLDLVTSQGMMSRLTIARASVKGKLQKLYGEKYYQELFEPFVKSANGTLSVGIGDHYLYKSPGQLGRLFKLNDKNDNPLSPHIPPNSTSTGWNRMVRALQIKLLQVQVGILQKQLDGSAMVMPKYVWMTSGDAAASGMGNFRHQTYTAVLEDTVKDAFGHVGIQFSARNYGHKLLTAAPEPALCAESIYGTDYDIMEWNYRDRGSKDAWKLGLHVYRTAVMTGSAFLPAFKGGRNKMGKTKEHRNVVSIMEKAGLAVLVPDPDVQDRLFAALPDSLQFRSKKELETALTPNLQKIKCGGELEDGGPTKFPDGSKIGGALCRYDRFDSSTCPKRNGAFWNPAWRSLALQGYTFAMLMLELLSDAIEGLSKAEKGEIDTQSTKRLEELKSSKQQQLTELTAAQTSDQENLRSSGLVGLDKWIAEQNKMVDVRKDINLTALFRSPALCHTGLLPAEIRYRGILTESNGTAQPGTGKAYERGIISNHISRVEKNGQAYDDKDPKSIKQEIMLVTDGLAQEKCNVPTVAQVVRLDNFYVSNVGGPQSLALPNDMERRYFDVAKSHGWIIVCLRTPEKKTKDLHLQILKNKSQSKAQIEITVNGVAVNGYVSPLVESETCRMLQHEDSDPAKRFTWTPNTDGKFEIQIQVHDKKLWSFLEISSFILM